MHFSIISFLKWIEIYAEQGMNFLNTLYNTTNKPLCIVFSSKMCFKYGGGV